MKRHEVVLRWVVWCRLRELLLLLAVAFLCGCAVFTGRPEPPFSEQMYAAKECRKVEGLSCGDTELLTQKEMADLVKVTNKDTRNQTIESALSVMNLRYSEFRHDFVANRKHLRAGIDALSLALNLAGTLTEATIPLQNYSVGSALLNGTGQNIDTNYLLNLTVDALIAQMDASRSEVELRIRSGMSEDISGYSGGQALRDLIDYFNAGTFLGGIRRTAAQGNAQNEENVAKIVKLRTASAEETKAVATITNRLHGLPDDEHVRSMLMDILVKLQIKPAVTTRKADLVKQLNDYRFSVATDKAKTAAVEKLILDSGLLDREK